MTTWSPQQETALKQIKTWLKAKDSPQVFYLGGYAGTGKSTLAIEAAGMAKGNVNFAAFTGKAALVMRQKGCQDASTIHQLIYRVDQEHNGVATWRLWYGGPAAHADLIIIDECSMVGEEIGRDLLSFGAKVLVLGDPAQLPPVKDAGFFTSRDPDFMLTEVHRQARDNPIISLSMAVREGERLQPGNYGESRVFQGRPTSADVLGADQVIVGRNKTRRSYNERIRQLKDINSPSIPVQGDKLICLRNKHGKGFLNGSLWSAEEIQRDGGIFNIRVSSQDFGQDTAHQLATVPAEFFSGDEQSIDWEVRRRNDEFDFGYVLTCHKSQGSQWPNVFIFDESSAFRDDARRWLYTAITRASEKVTVIQ